MDGVLGIDAAWTAKEPSGVALLAGSPGEWRCVAVAPSYDSFLALAEGMPVDWTVKSKGAVPDADQLVAAAENLLGGPELTLVTVDMPLSTTPITGRRAADNAISRTFGGKGASTHSPSVDRPGIISSQFRDAFADSGFPLAAHATPAGTPERLVEVYPHPALLTLTGASSRLPYKVNNSGRYWKGSSAAERKVKLLEQFEKILTALRAGIRGIELMLPEPEDAVSMPMLKRYEDSLDALVCAWVGVKYVEGDAVPYGDHTAAIWIPTPPRRSDAPAGSTPLYQHERFLRSTDTSSEVADTQLAEEFDYFITCLTWAGLQLDSHYFQINIAGSDQAVFRERVYCYELYHQLRNTLGDGFPYKLDGEIDKRRHPLLEPALGAKKPNFIVHEPSVMDRNLTVMEVKSLDGAQAHNMLGFNKDLKTLELFVRLGRYYRGVVLVYGDGRHELPPDIVTRVEEAQTQEDRILLVWHSGPGMAPKVV